MNQRLGLVALVVRDYDEALDFFVGTLGFRLAEDLPVPSQQNCFTRLTACPRAPAGRVAGAARCGQPAQ